MHFSYFSNSYRNLSNFCTGLNFFFIDKEFESEINFSNTNNCDIRLKFIGRHFKKTLLHKICSI